MQIAAAGLMVVGTVLSYQASQAEASALEQQGQVRQQVGELKAAQYTQQAGQERATAQRKSAEERRRGRIVSSNLQARAAMTGATTDPTVLDLEGEIAGDTTYRALTRLFEGEDSARDLEFAAELERIGAEQAGIAGRTAAKATRRRAVVSLLTGLGTAGLGLATSSGGGGSLLSNYGGGGPPSSSYGFLNAARGY